MHWAFPFFMEARFGPSDKRIKTIDIKIDEVFQKNSRIYTV
jgi:hypothetical protein